MADRQLVEQAGAAVPASDWILARITELAVASTRAVLADDFLGAAQLLQEGAQLAFTPASQSTVDAELASCLLAAGDVDGARLACTRLELAADLLHSDHAAAAAALTRAGLAIAARSLDRLAVAAHAVEVAETTQSQVHLIDAAELVALALIDDGRNDRAAPLFAAVQHARAECCYRWRWPAVREMTAALRGIGVGAATSERRAIGHEVRSLREAVAIALDPTGQPAEHD